ncbi:unnamed protein product [Paramecium octaurelia]|uniref:Uncharacterized protein n=1 Tax=Paramecium octaurelia TaxID=43137 RepID=A0A8S1TQZ3_PAROT|nr:unnamed protein product [Paramecium octaurelia]
MNYENNQQLVYFRCKVEQQADQYIIISQELKYLFFTIQESIILTLIQIINQNLSNRIR